MLREPARQNRKRHHPRHREMDTSRVDGLRDPTVLVRVERLEHGLDLPLDVFRAFQQVVKLLDVVALLLDLVR